MSSGLVIQHKVLSSAVTSAQAVKRPFWTSMVETAVEEGTWCSLLAYMCVCSCVRVHECTHTYTHARTHTHTHTHTHTQISTPHTHICEHLAYFLQGTEWLSERNIISLLTYSFVTTHYSKTSLKTFILLHNTTTYCYTHTHTHTQMQTAEYI
jgi:hypothetical protein